MTKQTEHGRLIAVAAKAALEPVGCKRVRQSRLWISDQRYWLITVEFQPSAWSKGSYLNVRPQWLWLRLGANDSFPRPTDYIEFKNAEHFTPLIEDMAAIAAKSVLALRARFPTLAHVYRYFAESITSNGWPVYRAAVTAGLLGEIETARQLFNRLKTFDIEGHESWAELKAEGAALAAQLHDPAKYQSVILDTVTAWRKQYNLPPDLQCLDPIAT